MLKFESNIAFFPHRSLTFSTLTSMREFNVTGICIPGKHYMVDISNKVSQIAAMVEKGQYFTINRARQYGKTTTLWLLDDELVRRGYAVAHISFEGIGDTPFENERNFCQSIIEQIYDELKRRKIKGFALWKNNFVTTFKKLDKFLDKTCKDKKLVLMIDETDKTSNNLVFLRFIGMLRDKYLLREKSGATFQSVILSGVYDIKNLKIKLIQKGLYQLQDGEKRINSPWNIAVHFNVDMSFSAPEIATMLNEYEKDHKTGMDIEVISKELRAYTNGYPFLVSRLCQIIDEDLSKDWTANGVQEAVKILLNERNTLFDDLSYNIENNRDLFDLLHDIIVEGKKITYNNLNSTMNLALTFGILQETDKILAVSNKIFETAICDYFISLSRANPRKSIEILDSEVIENGKFNMAICIKKFMQHYYELYNKHRESFLESECRLLFLTYLKPLINGKGFYHIESETRNLQRTDLIVDFGTEQFIVELKLWHGEQKHEKAHEQLIKYLDSKNKSEGYLLTFDFRKRRAKKPSAKWVRKGKKKFLDCLAV
ncbi:hypothetical protein R83H12_02913 [Fibrobacteria bacterium R8-3-H12]